VEQKQILVVDDEFNTRFAIDFTLSNAGYTVTQARNGDEALTILKEKKSEKKSFNLVVTDIQMPDMTGIELIDAMKQAHIHLPVLVITGFGDKKTLVELIRRRCNYYLDKPFSPAELLAGVEEVLQKKETQQPSVAEVQEKLMKSEKMNILGQMTSKIAHEINNPAQVIQGFAELLMEKKNLDTATKKMVQSIYEAVQSITKLNRDLMDVARPRGMNITDLKPEEPLDKALTFLKEAGVIKRCEIIKQYAQDMPGIRGDLMQLNQVFLNLILNAAHAMNNSQTKKLTVETGFLPDTGSVLISVSDTGCGIPRENIDKIFESFFTTRASEGGTGLGLAVVKQIVEGHKGKVMVTSEPGSGTTFTISLPAAT